MPPTKRKRWEYLIENNFYYKDNMELQMQTVDVAVNGEAGWELCGIDSCERFKTFYFKREKLDAKD